MTCASTTAFPTIKAKESSSHVTGVMSAHWYARVTLLQSDRSTSHYLLMLDELSLGHDSAIKSQSLALRLGRPGSCYLHELNAEVQACHPPVDVYEQLDVGAAHNEQLGCAACRALTVLPNGHLVMHAEKALRIFIIRVEGVPPIPNLHE